MQSVRYIPAIKKISILVLFLIGIKSAKAQQPVALPTPYTTNTPVNYVRTWDIIKPTNSANNITVSTDVKEAKMGTQYFDGMGRPLQTVIKQGSLETNFSALTSTANAYDLINMNVYDEAGRERYKYHPTPANGALGNLSIRDGLFKLTPFQQQNNFLNLYHLNNQDELVTTNSVTENWAYGKTNYEASPLNRPVEIFSPGISWVGSENVNNPVENKSLKLKYWFNTDLDEVRIWDITDGAIGAFSTYNSPGAYLPGQLYKNVTEDEHGNQIIEFKDKTGLSILKKVQLTALKDDGSGRGHNGWLCTYYIYDDLSRLRSVMQPEGVKSLNNGSWTMTANILQEQVFRYEYDSDNRIVIKKVPGAGEVYMVYDKNDRLVMTQDANMRIGLARWLITKYDDLNRPSETGIWNDNTAFVTHLESAAESDEMYPITTNGYEQLSVNYYDSYDWANSYATGFKNYDVAGLSSYGLFPSNTTHPYPQPLPVSKSIVLKGKVTGGRIKILNSSPAKFITNIIFYDDYGRVIQSRTINETEGIDVLSTQYSWNAMPLITVQEQNIQTGSGINITMKTITKLTYDGLGRLVQTDKKIASSLVNNGAVPSEYTTLSRIEYDAYGSIKKKTLGPDYEGADTKVEELIYDYNIKGWLLGVNRDYVRGDNNNHHFGFDLGYDKVNNRLINNKFYAQAQYNGNIAGMVWKSKGSNETRKYDFDYDAANRLLKADFTQYTNNNFNQAAGINYNMKMGNGTQAGVNDAYDANGNIKQMQHWGMKLTGSEQIDNLRYTHIEGSNRLRNVVDFNNDADTKLGDFRTALSHSQQANKLLLTPTSSLSEFDAITDYTYDANGNMVSDENKAISNIIYNHLNLPQKITVEDKGEITYVYDAAGVKIKKTTVENNVNVTYNENTYTNVVVTTTLHYLGSTVLESKQYSDPTLNAAIGYTYKLQFIGHEEGRVRLEKEADNLYLCDPLPDRLVYDYMIKDHLGNVRMILRSDEKRDICYLSATIEATSLAEEKRVYEIEDAQIELVNNIPGANNNSSFGTQFYRTNGSVAGEKTGLGVVLKVMGGDQVAIAVESYYNMPAGGSGSVSPLPLTDLLNALVSSTAISATKGVLTTSVISNIPNNTSLLTGFVNNNTPPDNTYAKAHLNWILFDEQMKFVNGGSDIVSQNGGYKLHSKFSLGNDMIEINKNGYLYIYVSNESNLDVYFDNLMVRHMPGLILEETHYYPFGLIMSGMSSKALNGAPANKYKFGGKELQNAEFSDGSGLEIYDFSARSYDHQVGVFRQNDPHSFNYYSWTPYNYCANNPIIITDPTGKDWFEDKDGNLIWNSSRDKTYKKEGVEYKNIGTTISITTISAIRNPNDIPVSFDVSGNKLQNTYSIEGTYDKDGEFSGFSTTFTRITGKTKLPIGIELKGSETVKGKTNSNRAMAHYLGKWLGEFEQHTEVNWLEKPILLLLSGGIVDVNVRMIIEVNEKGGLNLNLAHGTFPSVTTYIGTPSDLFKTPVYDYQQASFITTHASNILVYNQNKSANMTRIQQVSNEIAKRLINKGWVHFMGFNAGANGK
jgi:RHS repeat-associated protein